MKENKYHKNNSDRINISMNRLILKDKYWSTEHICKLMGKGIEN